MELAINQETIQLIKKNQYTNQYKCSAFYTSKKNVDVDSLS